MTLLSFGFAVVSAVLFAIALINEDRKCKAVAAAIGTVVFIGGFFTL